MKRFVFEMRWTILWTILIGVILSSSLTDYATASYKQWYDDTHPVVVMTGRLVSRTESTAVIHVRGVKLRQCRFVSLHAYASKGGELTDAYKERLGKIEDGSTKQIGAHDLGRWEIWPISGADRVIMTVLHDCAGRLMSAEIADVAI